MDAERRELRQRYWEEKYCELDWEEDIHFALFPPGDVTPESFRRGIKLNTEDLARDLHEMASIYRLTAGLRILDFGCGAGDFIIRMAEMDSKASCVGIDLADTAMERASKRTPAALKDRVKWIAGGLTTLTELCGNSQPFDVIVCRDMYYLLDTGEQDEFFDACSKLLGHGGLLYVADLAIEDGLRGSISEILLERQFGGDPITWKAGKHTRERVYSILAQADRHGFCSTRAPRSNESAVAYSYHAAAATVDDPAIRAAYTRLATAAGLNSKKHSPIPYVRFYFCRKDELPAPTTPEKFGIVLKQDFAFDGRTLMRAGEWLLPTGVWTLVLGRSGAGKTTLLRLLSGLAPPPGVDLVHKGNGLPSVFLLSQTPVVIEDLTVQDNIKLFAKNQASVDGVLDALGFDSTMALRKANRQLSGGEAQRVALGQAIAADPSLLLLDEPGVGIDRIRRYQFFSTIKNTFANGSVGGRPRTVICVDHEFVLIEEFFDCVFEILNGRLVWMKGA